MVYANVPYKKNKQIYVQKRTFTQSNKNNCIFPREKLHAFFFFLIYKSNTKGSSYTGGQGSQSGNCVSYL